jgi:hypothetical protein
MSLSVSQAVGVRMRSWVRYSVTVYLGLLLAGSIASPVPEPTVPKSNLRASYQTTSPRTVPKLDPASTQSKGVMRHDVTGIAWQSSARADPSR